MDRVVSHRDVLLRFLILMNCRSEDVALPDVHTKKAFIHGALDKEIRLSFAQRIKGTIPEPYQPLISEAKEKDSPDFKFSDEAVPFSAQGLELAQLIRKKATEEEFAPVLQAIEEAATQSGVANPQLSSTDALVTAICWVGSKSLSHVLACIERCRDRLMIIANTSPADLRQIITSVMDYWRDQPGVGVNIVDKLLNYKILTPTSVIEWALVDKVERGTALATSWIYELIFSTTNKVANRVRAIVRASRQPGLPAEQGEVLRQSLETEMADMKALFAIIVDTLLPIRDGNQDQMMESSDALREEEEAMVKMWAVKYLRVFQRKLAVEESWVKEELLKPIPAPPPEPMEEVEITATGNGEMNGNGDAKEEEERGGKRAKLDNEEKIE
jgi:nuclear cap-binding protein subunit 1